MKNSSLESVISDMVRRLDAVRPEDQGQDNVRESDDPLCDLDLFLPSDSVLASLQKHYLEANSRHKKLISENGFDDPMAEIAADMLDSARSAVQTRLIELKEICEEEMHEKLQRNLLARRAEEEIKLSRELIEKRKKDKDGDLYFWLLAFYWFMGRTIIATRKTLSAAHDFALVSSYREKRTHYA